MSRDPDGRLTIDRNLFTRPHQWWPIRSRNRRERRQRDETKNGEVGRPLAKNSQRSPKMQRASSDPVVLLVPPCYSPPGRGGQLFYWLRVAAHALGATVSVNRAKPPKSERRIIALVNLRARRPSFSFIRRRHLSRRMSQFPCPVD